MSLGGVSDMTSDEGEEMLLAGNCDFYVVAPIEWELLLELWRN